MRLGHPGHPLPEPRTRSLRCTGLCRCEPQLGSSAQWTAARSGYIYATWLSLRQLCMSTEVEALERYIATRAAWRMHVRSHPCYVDRRDDRGFLMSAGHLPYLSHGNENTTFGLVVQEGHQGGLCAHALGCDIIIRQSTQYLDLVTQRGMTWHNGANGVENARVVPRATNSRRDDAPHFQVIDADGRVIYFVTARILHPPDLVPASVGGYSCSILTRSGSGDLQ